MFARFCIWIKWMRDYKGCMFSIVQSNSSRTMSLCAAKWVKNKKKSVSTLTSSISVCDGLPCNFIRPNQNWLLVTINAPAQFTCKTVSAKASGRPLITNELVAMILEQRKAIGTSIRLFVIHLIDVDVERLMLACSCRPLFDWPPSAYPQTASI